MTAQRSLPAEQQKIVEVINTFFSAAHDDDLAMFHSIVAPGFYIFDNGVRLDGDSLMTLLKKMHATGARFEWHVTEPDIHINGNTAWIAYTNKGNITNATRISNGRSQRFSKSNQATGKSCSCTAPGPPRHHQTTESSLAMLHGWSKDVD